MATQSEARVVIIGAGIVGSSAAYYLSQKGWQNIVVIEQGHLFEAGGSTSHAPGLVFQTNTSKAMCQLSQWSVQLYSQLRLYDQPCYYPVGSLEIAYTPERREELKRKLGHALAWGLEALKWDCFPVSLQIADAYHARMRCSGKTSEEALRDVVAGARGVLGPHRYMMSCAGNGMRDISMAFDLFDGGRIRGDVFGWDE